MSKISMDKQYRTRDGREVRIYAVDAPAPECVVGSRHDEYGGWFATGWRADGHYYSNGDECCHDLIEVRPRIKRTRWINIYPLKHQDNGYSTKRDADLASGSARIACIKVEIDAEHGEGLS